MENILSKLSLNTNCGVDLSNDKYHNVIKISYKSDFPLIKPIISEGDTEPSKNYSLNILYTGGIKTYVNNNSNADGYSTDIGWGCMIRSTQSLLANSLVALSRQNGYGEETLLQICESFKDDYKYPFSIHNITTLGKKKFKVNIGDWFGPSVASQCIQHIIQTTDNKLIKSLICDCLVTIDSGTIYEDEVEKALKEKKNNMASESSVLVLLCVRLGLDNINEEFYESLLDIFRLGTPDGSFNFVGIAGGKPFKSLYFFDSDKDNNLVYADPHYASSYTRIENDDEELLKDFRDTHKLCTAALKELDPSMCIGFTVKNMEGLESLKTALKDNKILGFGNKSKELALLNTLSDEDFM